MTNNISDKPADKPADKPKKNKTLFDHVNHIRQVQHPQYYISLSPEDKKSFNHFMIIRALSMDSSIVEDMAALYQYFDKIPSEQFYKLLISLVPKSRQYHPWIKSRKLKHKKELLNYVSKRFEVPTYQANEYVNILLKTEEGQTELVNICKSFGLDDKQIEEVFSETSYN